MGSTSITAEDDTVSVTIDLFQDAQCRCQFSANGYIIQAGVRVGGVNDVDDLSWDVLYNSAGMLVDDGWKAELAIPFKSLRYPSAPTRRIVGAFRSRALRRGGARFSN